MLRGTFALLFSRPYFCIPRLRSRWSSTRFTDRLSPGPFSHIRIFFVRVFQDTTQNFLYLEAIPDPGCGQNNLAPMSTLPWHSFFFFFYLYLTVFILTSSHIVLKEANSKIWSLKNERESIEVVIKSHSQYVALGPKISTGKLGTVWLPPLGRERGVRELEVSRTEALWLLQISSSRPWFLPWQCSQSASPLYPDCSRSELPLLSPSPY